MKRYLFCTILLLLFAMPAFSQDIMDVQIPLEFEHRVLNRAIELQEIRKAVNNKYQEFITACDKNNLSELNHRLGEIRQSGKEAADMIEAVNKENALVDPFGFPPADATSEYITIMMGACDNELLELVRIKEAGGNANNNQQRVRSIKNTLENKLIDAIAKFEQSIETSLIKESRTVFQDRAPYCQWLDVVLNEVKNDFRGLRSNPHGSLPNTWECKKVFPDAQQTYCKDLFGTSVDVIYITGNDFEAFSKIQRELYYQLAACDHKGCYHDMFTDIQGTRKYARTKAEVDAGAVSYYEFWVGSQVFDPSWTCKVSLSKAGGEYMISVNVKKLVED